MSEGVEGAPDTPAVLDSMTAAVVDALRVETAWIEPLDAVTAEDAAMRVPLVHRGARLGDLVVVVPAGRTFSAADVALLHDLARHAAVVVHAVRLTEALQESRARLVTTREEERRRLRRDLHDGLGPSLAAVVLKLNAVERITDDAERAHLLAETREETRAAIAEVRRLVDDLRPPAIDEVGLIGAIRQRALALCVGNHLTCEISGPPQIPPLPAAVEVAAYRIVSEALTNVVRHSGATSCHVRIAVNGAFEITVTDNGHGAKRRHRRGGVDVHERACRGAGRLLHHHQPSSRGNRPRGAAPALRGHRVGRAMTSILVADDHPAFRSGLRQMLVGVPDLTVVGEAATGAQALELVETLEPEVVVMDLRMPDLDGIEATRRLQQLPRPPAVIVLTMFEDDDSVFAAMRAGRPRVPPERVRGRRDRPRRTSGRRR